MIYRIQNNVVTKHQSLKKALEGLHLPDVTENGCGKGYFDKKNVATLTVVKSAKLKNTGDAGLVCPQPCVFEATTQDSEITLGCVIGLQ